MVLTMLREMVKRKLAQRSRPAVREAWKRIRLYAELLEDRIVPALGDLLQTFKDPSSAGLDSFGGAVAAAGSNVLIGAPQVGGDQGAAYLYSPSGTLMHVFGDPNNTANDFFGTSVSGVGTGVLIGANGVNGRGAAYLYDASGNLIHIFNDPAGVAGDDFGVAVAAVGTSMLIGADGVNGGQGAAYLYDSSGNLLHTFADPAATGNDFFGFSVAAAGANVLVGAFGTNGFSGAAYLLDPSGTILATFTNNSLAAGALVGYSVAAVGTDVVVGAPGVNSFAGSAFLYDQMGNLLQTLAETTSAANDQFGVSVAAVGSNALVGANGVNSFSGAAYLFDTSANLVNTFADPAAKANDDFGFSVSSVSNTALIGSDGLNGQHGGAYLYDGSNTLMTTFPDPNGTNNDHFGLSVATLGSNVLVGSEGASGLRGRVYQYDSSGRLVHTFADPNNNAGDFFGHAVTAAGSNLLVGAIGVNSLTGAAYLYDGTGRLLDILNDPGATTNDFFGWSVTAVGSDLLVGAPGVSGFQGAAYLFDGSGNLLKTLTEPTPAANDQFGFAVTAVGNNLLISANAVTGASGAAYLFDQSGNLLHTFLDPAATANDFFGSSLAVVGTGVLIGAPGTTNGQGAAYLYDATGTPIHTFLDPGATANDQFGTAVVAVGSGLLVGAAQVNGSRGAAYQYTTLGTLVHTYNDPNNKPNDFFGIAAAALGNDVVVGADGVAGQRGAAYLFDATIPAIPTQLAFNVQPSATTAGRTIAPAVTVLVEDSLGNVVSTDNSSVTLAIGTNPAGGTLGGTVTVQAVSGVATFSTLSINKSGAGYTLSAADGSLTGATSSSFNITPGTATKLAFGIQPTSTTAGSTISPSVTVLVQDSLGNVVTSNSSAMTLAIGTNPGSGTLSGTATLNAVSGVATFGTLVINKTGAGYTLTAADGSLTGATSSAFNITPGAANHFSVVATPTTVTAGSGFLVTVTALDNLGNTDTNYNQIATFASADPLALVPAPATPVSAGVGLAVGALDTVGMWTVTANAPGGVTGPSNPVQVQANVATHLVVATTANPAITGSPVSVTVTAEDVFNNVATGYTGAVSLTSTDAAASFTPNPYPFVMGDQGIHTFSATFNTPGSQTVTARDTGNGAINGTSNAIATRGLEVLGVAVQPSGFTLTFNKPFNPAVLNLYDGGSSTLSPADLTLVGATSGAVTNGSLVVTSPTTLTYIYTFGVLPDDHYTLVLRSGINAFVDNAGVPLDGNNSGVPGTNYTTTFTTSFNASDVGLTIGSFARGPAQLVSLVVPLSSPSIYYPGLPIQLTDGNSATAAGFTLTYNTALLNVTGAVVDNSVSYPSAPSGSTFTRTSHTVVSGIATDVFAFSTNGNGNLGMGNGPVTIGELVATIPNTAGQQIYKAKEVLAISGASGDGTLPLVGASGIQLVAYPADASGDGAYAGNDGSLIGSVAGGQDTGFAAYPLVDPVIVADVAGEGLVTANGASQVAQVAVLRTVPNITPVPVGAQVLPSTAPDPLLSIPGDLRVGAGGTVSVPVNLDQARPAGSTGLTEATLALRFDPSIFTVSAGDIHLGSIPQAGSGWTLTSAVDPRTGALAVTLYSLTPISSNLGGSLVTIDFHARPGALPAGSAIELAASVDPNGQGWYVTNLADTRGALILGMLPTNQSDSPVASMVVLGRPAPGIESRASTTIVAAPLAAPSVPQALDSVVAADEASVEHAEAQLTNETAGVPAGKDGLVSPAVTMHVRAPTVGLVFQVAASNVAVNPLLALLANQDVADRLVMTWRMANPADPGRFVDPGDKLVAEIARELTLTRPAPDSTDINPSWDFPSTEPVWLDDLSEVRSGAAHGSVRQTAPRADAVSSPTAVSFNLAGMSEEDPRDQQEQE
jgi:hypothetical protein